MTYPPSSDPFDRSLRLHVQRANGAISVGMADARAHTLAGSPSTAAARLDGLLDSLIGPGGTGIIGDARARFYHDAHRHPPFDPAIHDPARRHPTPESSDRARTAKIGGVDARQEAAQLIELAKAGLRIASADTGDPGMTRSAIDTWHVQHRDRLRGWAKGQMSDDQMSLLSIVTELREKEEYRDGR